MTHPKPIPATEGLRTFTCAAEEEIRGIGYIPSSGHECHACLGSCADPIDRRPDRERKDTRDLVRET